MELEIINKLFLELSQIATAKTRRELDMEARLKRAADVCYQLCLQIESSGASPELTQCSVMAANLLSQLIEL
jgi:hypothetical protein